MTAAEGTARREGLRIFKNTAILGLGTAAGMALGFVTTILVTDSLGQSYGLFLSAQRFVGFFTIVVEFGLSTLLVRSVAARRDSVGALLGTVLALRCGLGVAFGLLVGLGAFTLDYLPDHRWLVAAFVALELTCSFAESFVAAFQGLEAMGRATLLSVARSLATCAGVLIAVGLGGGLLPIVLAYLGGRILHLLAALLMTRSLDPRPRLAVRPEQMPVLLREAVLFVAVGLGYGAMRSLDVVMLTLLSVGEVARYGAALNFVEVLLAAPLLVQTALLPAFTRLIAVGQSAAIGRHTLQLFSAVLLPTAVGLAILADRAVQLYPSGGFADSAVVLRILAGGFCFLSLASVSATILTGNGRLRPIVAAYAIALAGQAIVNLSLIPKYGAVGAAVGTVTGSVLLAITLVSAVRRVGVEYPLASLLGHLGPTALMGAAVFATRSLPLALPLTAGVVAYATGVLLLSPPRSIERSLASEVICYLKRGRLPNAGSGDSFGGS